MKKNAQPKNYPPIIFPRADPCELARFDPRTKTCVMNCGPHTLDPRTKAERMLLCDDCFVNEVKQMKTCNALGMIRNARALLNDEAKTYNSRELAMVLTKLDEAELWRLRLQADELIAERDRLFIRAREWAESSGRMERERDALRARIDDAPTGKIICGRANSVGGFHVEVATDTGWSTNTVVALVVVE